MPVELRSASRAEAPRSRPGAPPRAARPAPPPSAPHQPLRRRPAGARLSFLLPAGVYLVAGALLAFRYESFHGDAVARVANGYYVLFSRDPHLAAIGFVWSPLPSLAVLPLLPFKLIWPALTERAFAGNIVSALAMAGAVHQLHATLADVGVRRGVRLVAIGLFAFHPMILFYGANGMSEAMLLLTLVLATRHLGRWLRRGELTALVAAGICLALAYLTRAEALFAVPCATLVVLWVAARRRQRWEWASGVAHAIVFSAPAVASFFVLAAISWVTVGHPIEHLSSVYGNASQLRLLRTAGSSLLEEPLSFALQQVWVMSPLLPVAALTAWLLRSRRDRSALAPVALLGGVLGPAVLLAMADVTVSSTRYFITAAPLTALLAAMPLHQPVRSRAGPRALRSRGPHGMAAGALAAILLSPGIPSAAGAMLDAKVDPEDRRILAHIFEQPGGLTDVERAEPARYREVTGMARHLDRLATPNGSILLDTFNPCVPLVVLASRHPKRFVITHDRDFQQRLADPAAFGVRYLVVPPPGGLGDLDALNRTYPTLYTDGAGIATLEGESAGSACLAFRLYRVNAPPATGPR